jgi:prepilin-type N-terminal cleavage/methylation domain-containing protein
MGDMTTRARGFTLVEIAIVLVIIGLLLGGILKGQEMLTQARIKNLVSDFNGISAAYYGYIDRYRKQPGDDGDASTRWTLGIAAPASGAFNDGQIAGTYASTTANDESRLFWLHLRKAGFIAGTDQEQPMNTVNGKIGVQAGALGLTGLVVCLANIPDKMAIAIDAQMDDGKPNTGSVRAMVQTALNEAVGAAVTGAAAQYEESGKTYIVCRQL